MHRSNLRLRLAAVASAVVVTTTLTATAAQAAYEQSASDASAEKTASATEATAVFSSAAVSRSSSVRDLDCEASVADGGAAGSCVKVSELAVGASSVASASQVAQYAGVQSADGTTLAEAAAAGTIYTRTWSQEKRGLYYVNWKEKHIGRIFYDRRSRVWSTTQTSGYKGYHKCDQGYGVLYDVQVKDCSTERRYDLNDRPISEWDRFRVHVVWRGVPLYTTHNMHVNAYPSGAIYGH